MELPQAAGLIAARHRLHCLLFEVVKSIQIAIHQDGPACLQHNKCKPLSQLTQSPPPLFYQHSPTKSRESCRSCSVETQA